MESQGDSCSLGGSEDPEVVCEKRLFKSGLPECLVQVACGHQHCAFPLNRNELCVWNAAGSPAAQPLRLLGHQHAISALSFGSKINPLLVCSASRERVIVWNLDECTTKLREGLLPQGIIIGTLLRLVLYVRFSPDDQQVAVCAGNRIYMLSAKNKSILVKLNGHLAPVTAAEFCTWEKNMLISVSEDRSFKVWDYSTGLLMYQSGILTAFPLLSLLIDEEKRQIITGCAEGQLWIFSLSSDHNYRCVAHTDLKKEQEKFYNKIWKSEEELGERQNASELCKTNSMKPEGSVEASLPVLLIEHCDYSVCFHNEENISYAQNRSYFWIGTSTGLLLINLANLELEAFLCYKDYSGLSIQFARSCSLMKKAVNGKVLCLITSMFEDIIAVLEVNPALLVTSQQSGILKSGNEGSLSAIARCPLLPKSPLCKNLNKNKKCPSKTYGVKSTVKDQPLVFHNKIKSSGYTAAPQMAMFSPNTKLKKNNLSKCKTSSKGKNKEYPLESSPPINHEAEISVSFQPTRICCVQYSGDGNYLACGLANKTVLIFNPDLTNTHHVFTGHDGAVNSVGWSHDRKWIVSTSDDRTVRVWSVCKNEPALILGKEMFHRAVGFAQFYFMDTFILLCCGAEFHLLSFHLDATKDDLRRYKQKSICKLVQKFPMASTVEITSLSAVNDFYSYQFNFNTENFTDIVLTAGSNRALEVFDLNAGRSTAVIPDVHTRAVHQICQNKGSAFSTQKPEAYNLFMTTAIGDGIKLWDLRTLKCERRFEGHGSRSYPCGIAVSPCGKFIASGSDDKCRNTCRRHFLTAKSKPYSYRAKNRLYKVHAVMPEHSAHLSVPQAYIYEMHSSTFSYKLGGHTESVTNVAFSPFLPQKFKCKVEVVELESELNKPQIVLSNAYVTCVEDINSTIFEHPLCCARLSYAILFMSNISCDHQICTYVPLQMLNTIFAKAVV